jgi:hypothetical protein
MKRNRVSTGLSGQQLKRLLLQLCERAQDDVSRTIFFEEEATHQLRVRMKKVLALLRLAGNGVERQTLLAMRQHGRAVKSACAGSRDLVVKDKIIDKLVQRFHLAPRHRPVLSEARTALDLSMLRCQLLALEELLETTSIEALSTDNILAAHSQCYRKGRRLMKDAFETTDSRVLHRWRHRVKDLYFQSLALPRLAESERRIRRSRRLGQLLGRDQDLANLMREPAFKVRHSPWIHVIAEHRAALRERYLRLGHKLYAHRCSHFTERVHQGV